MPSLKEEKTALELNMYHRYDEGYYDAEGKVMQANQLLSVMAEAEEEIRRSEEFAEAGIDPELMKRSFERMQQMHRIVIDELSRRGEE